MKAIKRQKNVYREITEILGSKELYGEKHGVYHIVSVILSSIIWKAHILHIKI